MFIYFYFNKYINSELHLSLRFVCISLNNYRFQRPAGAIPSSMLGLEAMTGRLDDFGFEDYLNGKKTLFINQLNGISFVRSNCSVLSL